MRICVPLRRPLAAAARHTRWRRDESGATAIEFAFVALPFFMFVIGLLGLGLYFMTSTALEHGVQSAARKVRTGQAENESMTVRAFKDAVCTASAPVIDCAKLSVLVQHATDWSGISPRSCTDSKGAMVGSTGDSGEMISKYSGTADEVVLVTLCYRWDLARSFKFLKLDGGNGTGAAIIQAATAFKNEPYK